MFLLTKNNISEELLVELVGQTVMLDTKFGTKVVLLNEVMVSRGLSKQQGSGQSGYIFSRVQGPYLMRTGTHYILHGTASDLVAFIKNDDYFLEAHNE